MNVLDRIKQINAEISALAAERGITNYGLLVSTERGIGIWERLTDSDLDTWFKQHDIKLEELLLRSNRGYHTWKTKLKKKLLRDIEKASKNLSLSEKLEYEDARLFRACYGWHPLPLFDPPQEHDNIDGFGDCDFFKPANGGGKFHLLDSDRRRKLDETFANLCILEKHSLLDYRERDPDKIIAQKQAALEQERARRQQQHEKWERERPMREEAARREKEQQRLSNLLWTVGCMGFIASPFIVVFLMHLYVRITVGYWP